MNFDVEQLSLTAPLLVVSLGGVILLLLEAFSRSRGPQNAIPSEPRSYLAAIALLILGLAGALAWHQWDELALPRLAYNGMLAVDRYSLFFDLVFFSGAGLAILLGGGFMREQRFEFGEYYALILLGTAGMMILSMATDFVALFIGLETMSLAVYVLTGSWRRSARSSEGALKYFLIGSFASALMLYGIALVYGTAGSTSLPSIGMLPHGEGSPTADPVFLLGFWFICAGLAFKIAAVPFHFWAPDAYEGAPTPVTAFMAAGVKAAGFATLIRLFTTAFGRPELTFGAGGWASLAAVLAIITMTLGNVAALRQENIKRMLAYSSISHAGYLLVGVAAMGLVGAEARGPMLFYLLAYSFTTIGSFGVVAWYASRGNERQNLDDWAGLASRHPAAALAMTVFLLSLGGFPPTAGFFAKFYVFRAALSKPGLLPLIVVAVLNSVISVFYYLRPITAMYFREPGREGQPVRSTGMNVALLIAALAVLAIGLYPAPFLDAAIGATLLLPTGTK